MEEDAFAGGTMSRPAAAKMLYEHGGGSTICYFGQEGRIGAVSAQVTKASYVLLRTVRFWD